MWIVLRQMDKHLPDISVCKVKKFTQIKHWKFGLRDIKFSDDKSQLIWLAADAGAIKKLTSSLNFFSKKEEDKTSEGVFESYSLTLEETDGSKMKVANLFKKYLESPGICLDWDQSAQLISIGLENGSIMIFEYNETEGIAKPNLLCSAKVHEKRILSVRIDSQSKCVFSISKGSKLKVYDYSKKLIVSGKNGIVTQ